MTMKMNLCMVGLLVTISFILGAVFAPGPASSGTYTTCNAGIVEIHMKGLIAVYLDKGLKVIDVIKPGDSQLIIRVAEK